MTIHSRVGPPAYDLYGVNDRLGVNYTNHGHAFTAEDWNAMLDFFDSRLPGKKIDRPSTGFPPRGNSLLLPHSRRGV